jgi:hypothetical protein
MGLEGSGLRTGAVEVVAAAEILMEDSDSESWSLSEILKSSISPLLEGIRFGGG